MIDVRKKIPICVESLEMLRLIEKAIFRAGAESIIPYGSILGSDNLEVKTSNRRFKLVFYVKPVDVQE